MICAAENGNPASTNTQSRAPRAGVADQVGIEHHDVNPLDVARELIYRAVVSGILAPWRVCRCHAAERGQITGDDGSRKNPH
jgi:isopentenyldiphosphate isomerase